MTVTGSQSVEKSTYVFQMVGIFYVSVVLDQDNRIFSIINKRVYQGASPAHKAAKEAAHEKGISYIARTISLQKMITVCQPNEQDGTWYPAYVDNIQMRVLLQEHAVQGMAEAAEDKNLGSNDIAEAIRIGTDIAVRYNMIFQVALGDYVTKAIRQMRK